MASQAFIVAHQSGHRYFTWVEPSEARSVYATRKADRVASKFGGPAWAILVPDEVVARDVKTEADWQRIGPETPGVTLYARNGLILRTMTTAA